MQDQVSGKVIVKKPKVGRLFPLQFSSIKSCAYSTVINNFWHKKLGHPNSTVLAHLMRYGYLGKNILWNLWIVVLANWAKAKHYHFLRMVVVLLNVLTLYILMCGV